MTMIDQSRRERHAQVRALCCDCGNVRTTSTYGSHGEPDAAVLATWARFDLAPSRCTVWRKCQICGEQTRHAWLRDDLPAEDRADLDAPLSQRLSPLVSELVQGLRACGVRVWWEPAETFRPRQVAALRQWLDDNSWHVELNPAAHVVHLIGALEAIWLQLAQASDDLGGDGWRSVAGVPGDPDFPPCRYRVFSVPESATAA